MNDTSTILLLAVIGTWFFTNKRSQAFLSVLKNVSPSSSNSGSVLGTTPTAIIPDTTDIPLVGSDGITTPSTIDLNNSNSNVG